MVNAFYSAPGCTGQPGSVRAPANCNTVAVTANTEMSPIALSTAPVLRVYNITCSTNSRVDLCKKKISGS